MSKYFKPGKIVSAAGYGIDLNESLITHRLNNIFCYTTTGLAFASRRYLVDYFDNFLLA